MKKLVLFSVLALTGAVLLTGCEKKGGVDVDTDKTAAQVQSEVASMKPEEIQAAIAKYQKKIEEKGAELKKETEKLSAIPLKDQMGDKAKDAREEVAKLTKELNNLKESLNVYLKAQSEKK